MTSVKGYILADFDGKSFQYKSSGRDGRVKSWILADYRDGIADVWRIKMVSWNDMARKFETALPKGVDVLVSNFTSKKSNW